MQTKNSEWKTRTQMAKLLRVSEGAIRVMCFSGRLESKLIPSQSKHGLRHYYRLKNIKKQEEK